MPPDARPHNPKAIIDAQRDLADSRSWACRERCSLVPPTCFVMHKTLLHSTVHACEPLEEYVFTDNCYIIFERLDTFLNIMVHDFIHHGIWKDRFDRLLWAPLSALPSNQTNQIRGHI
jgi:hypothetical protein